MELLGGVLLVPVPVLRSPFLSKPRTTFGTGGDIKPLSLTVVKDHCIVHREEREGKDGEASPESSLPTLTLECGEGDTYINGR